MSHSGLGKFRPSNLLPPERQWKLEAATRRVSTLMGAEATMNGILESMTDRMLRTADGEFCYLSHSLIPENDGGFVVTVIAMVAKEDQP